MEVAILRDGKMERDARGFEKAEMNNDKWGF